MNEKGRRSLADCLVRKNSSLMLDLWKICTAIALTVIAGSVFASTELDSMPYSPHMAHVIWDSFSQNSLGSMPIGNGDIGANVWVESSGDLLLLLSKTDSYDEFGRLLKLGRLRIKSKPSLAENPFQQALLLVNGTLEIQSGTTRVRIWIDANHPVVQVDFQSESPMEVEVHNEVWRTTVRRLDRVDGREREAHSAYGMASEMQKVYPDTILPHKPDQIAWCHHNVESQWEYNLRHTGLEAEIARGTDPLLHRTFGAVVRGTGLRSTCDIAMKTIQPKESIELQVFPLTRFADSPSAWLYMAEDWIDRIPSSTEARFVAHQAWWKQYWGRSWISLSACGPEAEDAKRVSRAYAIQRFLTGCAGRGSLPIKFNGSIFTVDEVFDPDYRRWGGPYWFQNTRLLYWAMMYSGDYDLFVPFFKMYMDALPLRKAATKIYFGHEGAFYPETIHFWGNYTDENYGFNREGLPKGITENRYIRRHWEGALELVVMMLDYYDAVRDPEFRDNMLLPMAKEVTAAFDQHWKRGPDGKVLYHPAQSLETWWDCINPTPPIAGLRYLLPRLLALPIDEQTRDVWQKQLTDQPDIPSLTEAGRTRILPAQEFDTLRNSENPELYAVFPFRLFTQSVGGDSLNVGIYTWEKRLHRDNRGWQQQPIQAALLGLTDEAKRMVIERVKHTAEGYRFPGFYGPNYDWTPDQDQISVFMIALQYMAMQCEGDRILLLPAWPREWDVHFKLHAPYQTTIECVVQDGKVVTLVVQPEDRRMHVEICEPFACDE